MKFLPTSKALPPQSGPGCGQISDMLGSEDKTLCDGHVTYVLVKFQRFFIVEVIPVKSSGEDLDLTTLPCLLLL